MKLHSPRLTLILMLLLAVPGTAAAQEEQEPATEQDGASQQVEESDEAFRRRMELEDARYRDPTYVDPVGSYKRELEKIDKLPEESRDNVRDQLIDVIMSNGEWEPSDALEEYPYTPTEAAQADPKLAQQEQEAWDEQIEKYHERESEAFGAYRGPAQGPGNPDGPEGSQGDGQESGQQGEQGQQGGQQGDQGQQGSQGQQGAQGEEGTYQPRQSSGRDSSDEESRAGVSESALDFLMGRQGANQQASQQASQQESQQDSQQVSQQEPSSQSEESEPAEQPVQQDLRGVLAIEDLDKLGVGTGTAPPPPEEDEEDGGNQLP